MDGKDNDLLHGDINADLSSPYHNSLHFNQLPYAFYVNNVEVVNSINETLIELAEAGEKRFTFIVLIAHPLMRNDLVLLYFPDTHRSIAVFLCSREQYLFD